MIYHIVWGSRTITTEGRKVSLSRMYANYLNIEDEDKKYVARLTGYKDLYLPDIGGDKKFVADLNDPTKNDTYIFVLVKRQGQIEQFDAFIKKYELEKCVTFRSPLVTNPVHVPNGRQLQLVVMQSINHFQKELIK